MRLPLPAPLETKNKSLNMNGFDHVFDVGVPLERLGERERPR